MASVLAHGETRRSTTDVESQDDEGKEEDDDADDTVRDLDAGLELGFGRGRDVC